MKEKLTGNLKRTVKENLENTVKIIKLKEAYLWPKQEKQLQTPRTSIYEQEES